MERLQLDHKAAVGFSSGCGCTARYLRLRKSACRMLYVVFLARVVTGRIHSQLILSHYASSWLAIDLAAAIPFEQFDVHPPHPTSPHPIVQSASVSPPYRTEYATVLNSTDQRTSSLCFHRVRRMPFVPP